MDVWVNKCANMLPPTDVYSGMQYHRFAVIYHGANESNRQILNADMQDTKCPAIAEKTKDGVASCLVQIMTHWSRPLTRHEQITRPTCFRPLSSLACVFICWISIVSGLRLRVNNSWLPMHSSRICSNRTSGEANICWIASSPSADKYAHTKTQSIMAHRNCHWDNVTS